MKQPLLFGALLVLLVGWLVRPADAETIGDLVHRCAPHVAPRTALAIISVESSGVWYAVNDNDRGTPPFHSAEEAIAWAQERVAAGDSVDLGLAQLNSAHLREFGVSVREAFEPCTNVALGMTVLAQAWAEAQQRYGRTREGLYRAFEAYNGGAGSWDTASPSLRARVAHYAQTVWEVALGLAVAPSARPTAAPTAGARTSAVTSVPVHRRIVVLDDVAHDKGGF